jgi:hypothetical protein
MIFLAAVNPAAQTTDKADANDPEEQARHIRARCACVTLQYQARRTVLSEQDLNMKKVDIRDIIGGLAVIGCGVFATLYGQRYQIGDLTRMGPGYFPVALGFILIILGVLILLPAFFRQGQSIEIKWAGLVWILSSIVAFSLSMERLGLLIATVISVLLSTMASSLSIATRIVLSLAIATITYTVFIAALGMNISVWPF